MRLINNETGTIYEEQDFRAMFLGRFYFPQIITPESLDFPAEVLDGFTYSIYDEPINEPAPPTYRELREAEYPPIEEQLDMQYWDAVNGTTNWLDMITSIKNSIPKG